MKTNILSFCKSAGGRPARNYVTVAAVTLSLLLLSSCEKMLETDLPGNQIDGATVFNDVQTANAALAGLYAGLYDQSPLSGDTTGALLGYYTDDLDFFYTSTNAGGTADLFLNQQTANNTTIETYWNNAYQKIYFANAIIEGVSQSPELAAADKRRMTGEALMVRSLIYYYLEELFGSIPYVTTTDYTVNQSLGKTDRILLLEQLKQDVETSVSLLDDSYGNAERIFPNRKVAQLLLAKFLCLQQKWPEAEILLRSVAESPLYVFENDLNKVFDKSGKHILWQLKPKNPNDPTKEVQQYYFSGSAPALNALSSNLMNSFVSGDLRKSAWTVPVTVGTSTWYRANKYKNRTVNANEYSVVFRLEEVYLLLAEVLAQQDKTGEALPYVNRTRQRAGLQLLPATLTKPQLLEEILNENRKEFFTETGHRFLDLKRLNRLDILQTIKPNWKSFHALWPLPQKELLLNPHLNPQNPGY